MSAGDVNVLLSLRQATEVTRGRLSSAVSWSTFREILRMNITITITITITASHITFYFMIIKE